MDTNAHVKQPIGIVFMLPMEGIEADRSQTKTADVWQQPYEKTTGTSRM